MLSSKTFSPFGLAAMPSFPARLRALPYLLLTCLAACAPLGSKYQTPAVEVPPPPAVSVVIDREWWKAFGDPVLDELVKEALANNFDLAKAAANIEEARANLGSARAMLSPRLDGLAKADISHKQLNFATTSIDDFNKTTSSAGIGVAASWEVDLWGRIKEMNDAALARLSASEHTRNAATLSISGAVVDTWFQLRATLAKLEITRKAAENLKAASNLEYRRWKVGTGSELAYRQSVAEQASTEARIPVLEGSAAKAEYALQLLLGRSPRGMAQALPRGNVFKLPEPPRVIDSTVLLRRPDIASAEQLLAAAHADVNSARAEHYPRLTLSFLAGILTTTAKAVTGAPLFWDLAAGMSGPIFDGGLIDSKVDAAEARRQFAIANYRYTISLAFRETYEAMTLLETGDRQFKSSEEEVATRRKSLALNEKSYEAGRSSKFEVLSEMVKVLNSELSLVDARFNQMSSRSQYYKALGGGF